MSSIDDGYDCDEGDDCSILSDDNVSVYSNISLNHPAEAFKVITVDDVFCQMNQELRNISEAMNIPPTIARIIMDRYDWSSQSLMDKFLAADTDPDSFFRDARIMNPMYYKDHKGHDIVVADCLICFDTSETTGLQCGHKFCRDCWNQYLTSKIVEYGEQSIPCPDSRCNIIVEDVTVKSLVSDPNVLRKYNRLICNSFVKCKKNLTWCISPGCNSVIDVYDCTRTFVTCKCGSQFCLECHEEVHAPISCHLLRRWKFDDSITQSYLSVNTKPCPKCYISIEKNGGCPHMICTRCKYEFCWKCLVGWLKHNATYQCNNPEDDMKIRRTRTQLQRLTYCWDRYAYNRQALKDERDRFDFTWEQFEHRLELRASLNYMFGCRRFLMYSYAFVYYLKENNQVYILETNLDNIEAKVDRVSVLLENYIRLSENDDDFVSNEGPFRTTIVDSAAHCDVLRQTWLAETEEGQVTNTWEFREE